MGVMVVGPVGPVSVEGGAMVMSPPGVVLGGVGVGVVASTRVTLPALS